MSKRRHKLSIQGAVGESALMKIPDVDGKYRRFLGLTFSPGYVAVNETMVLLDFMIARNRPAGTIITA